jgi:transposase-like protein
MRGRHPSGPELVKETEGSDQARRRQKAMLETISGQKRVAEACAELGIGEAQFHKLRRKMMTGALASLEPAGMGSIARRRYAMFEVYGGGGL